MPQAINPLSGLSLLKFQACRFAQTLYPHNLPNYVPFSIYLFYVKHNTDSINKL